MIPTENVLPEIWWKDKVVYQIYPKSFYDSNGDGNGDLQGVIQKLPYLKELGIDIIWLCPVFRSPMSDNGYDISDYYGIDPRFGTNDDMTDLIHKAHQIGIRIILDLVINHSSDEHPWFRGALADPKGETAKFYIFREGVKDGPPNNWRAIFGGSVWEKAGSSDLYYYHTFGRKQPDLNWENPKLRGQLYKMINWWLDQGIAGFRIDAIAFIKKNQSYESYPADDRDGLVAVQKGGENQPGIEVFLRELKEKTFTRHNCLTVAEATGVPIEELGKYTGKDGFFSMIFNFFLSDMDLVPDFRWYDRKPWTVKDFRDLFYLVMIETQKTGYNPNFLENHDSPRSLNHFIPPEDIGYYSATMLATIFMMARGVPFIYQGEELGMTNCAMTSMDEFDDLSTHDQYECGRKAGLSHTEVMDAMNFRSRDHSRTPMQWNNEKNAGFTSGSPWLKVNPNYTDINAAQQAGDPRSVLSYYKGLLALRKASPTGKILTGGDFAIYPAEDANLICYTRSIAESGSLLVINNFSAANSSLLLHAAYIKVVKSNYPEVLIKEGYLHLQPYQSVILSTELKSNQ